MQDVLVFLKTLHRPPLLIRAARIGAQAYRRESHLTRILGLSTAPRPNQALTRLIEIEDDLNKRRDGADLEYSVSRHVEILAAMMGEARLMRSVEP